jgi:hypothetical protein
MSRLQPWISTTLLVLLLTFVSFACKHTPAPPCQVPTITFRADPVKVAPGGAVKLTWVSRNATAVNIQPGIGAVTPVAAGTRQIIPAASVTYAATATGACGTSADLLRITVNEPSLVVP